MNVQHNSTDAIPAWQLYGETAPFPDPLHCEQIRERAQELNWRIAPHRHARLHQILLFNQGSVRASLEGKTRVITAGHLLSIPAGVAHGFDFAADSEGLVLSIPLESLPQGPGAASTLAEAGAQVIASDDTLTEALAEIAQEHAARNAYRSGALQALASRILILIARRLDAAVGLRERPDPATQHLQRLADLVRIRLSDPMGLPEMARHLGLSERHLSRLTRQASGQSASAFAQSLRLGEAAQLLAYTGLPVSQIAFRTGFDDPAYFARCFSAAMGQSPRAYRQALNAN